MSRWLRVLTLTLLASSSCHDTTAPAAPTGVATAPATPAPPSPPPPSSSSTTTVASNRPPSVRLAGDEGCHPTRRGDVVEPCTVSFRAEASDPDGDPLRYRWSGCASGEGAVSTCRIDALETVTATVEVTDGRGGRVELSTTAEGTNLPPKLGNFSCWYSPVQNPGAPDCGTSGCAPPIPVSGIGNCWDGDFDAFDEERDGEVCGPVVPSGPCGPGGIYECGGVGGAFSFDFHTGSEEGECTFEINVRDDWGASSSTTVHVSVRAYP